MSSINVPEHYSDQLTAAEGFYTDIKLALRRLKARSQQLKYSCALLSWLASLSLLLIGWFLLGGVFRLPIALRVPLALIWAGCAIWTGYVFIFKAFTKRISLERMAFRIEQCYPEIQDRLISSLQLWPELLDNTYGYSANFITRLVQEAHVYLKGVDRQKVLSDELRRFKQAGIAMICVLVPLVVVIALFPVTFAGSLYTFIHPFDKAGQLNTVEITRVVPGNYTLLPGASVDIIADVTGPAPSAAELHYRSKEGEWNIIPLSGKEEITDSIRKIVFTTKLQNIKESLEYYVSVANVQSEQYLITVVYNPIVASLQLELQYPRYTGLPPRSLDANVGDVAAPPGTKVVIEATSSKDTASAFVVFDDKATTRLDVEEMPKLSGSFIVQRSGTYYISITDTEGQSNSDPIKYSINMVADQPPRVNILKPGEDIEIGQDMTIPLQVEAQDDYGVATMSLHYQIQGSDEKYKVPLGSYKNPQISVLLDYKWDLAPLRLFPEDVISYYAEAADADNISGPNMGRSAVFSARFPSLYDIYKQLENEQTAQQSGMEDIRSRQEDVKKMVDNLVEDLKGEKELDWAGKKELEKAAEMQRQIEEQMKDMAQQVNETVEKLNENPIVSMEIMEKLRELKKIMNELATDEMKQLMQKLSEALEKINPSQQQRDLMAASFKQEEFMEKLDRMIELFKNMQLRQKLEAAANQAQELVKQQTETLKQSEELANKGVNDQKDQARSVVLGDRETRIKNQTEELLKDLDGITEEMKEKLPNMAEMMKQITESAQKAEIPDQLRRAISELNNKNPAGSLQCQRNALSKLSGLQNDLQTACQAMEGQDVGEIIAALRDAIRDSLYLSHRHEEVMQTTMDFKGDPEQMLQAEKKVMDSLAAEEIDLAESAKKIATQLRDISRKTTAVSPELAWDLGRVADGMARSAAAMEDRIPTLVVPIQKNTLATLNSAIQDMLDSIDQINSQATPMAGMEDLMEQLRQLANQQSQLNQSTQDADAMQRKQGMTPSLEEMLEKMAAEQALIREATERLAAKLDKLAETVDRLEEVAREMQEVEGSLREGSLNRNIMEKQRRILTRLLEYEKSLKTQDFSRTREARTGRDYVTERPDSQLPDDATRIRQRMDTMLSPKAQEQWPTQYKELIRMYYKALSNTVRTQSGIQSGVAQ